jgi:hypothetical protein
MPVHIVSRIGLATVLWATATATCSAAAVGGATFAKPGAYGNNAETNITLIADVAGTPVEAENCNSPPSADGRSHRCCTPPKGKGDVNTAIIDPTGKIETLNCPNPTGDVTLNFGEQAGVVNPDGTSAIGDVAVGATGIEGALALAGVGAAIGIGGGLGLGGPPPVIPPVHPMSP